MANCSWTRHFVEIIKAKMQNLKSFVWSLLWELGALFLVVKAGGSNAASRSSFFLLAHHCGLLCCPWTMTEFSHVSWLLKKPPNSSFHISPSHPCPPSTGPAVALSAKAAKSGPWVNVSPTGLHAAIDINACMQWLFDLAPNGMAQS